MVLYNVLYRTFNCHSLCRCLCLFSIVDSSSDTYKFRTHLLVVECIVTDIVFQRKQVITFHEALCLTECNDKVSSGDGGFTHFRRAAVKRCFSGKCIVLTSRESHLRHLHGWFGFYCLDVNVKHILFDIAGTDSLSRCCCAHRLTVEVHRLRHEQGNSCLPSISSDVIGCIAEKDNRQRTVL